MYSLDRSTREKELKSENTAVDLLRKNWKILRIKILSLVSSRGEQLERERERED